MPDVITSEYFPVSTEMIGVGSAPVCVKVAVYRSLVTFASPLRLPPLTVMSSVVKLPS